MAAPVRVKRDKSDCPDRFRPEDVARIHERDKVCVLSLLVPGHVCAGRLTLEHVKDSPRMGKRACSDRFHAVLACLSGNAFTVETSKYRPKIREYLDKHEPRP